MTIKEKQLSKLSALKLNTVQRHISIPHQYWPWNLFKNIPQVNVQKVA